MANRTLGAHLGVRFPNQNIYESSDTQKQKLGERLRLGERVFHYGEAGATALAPGKLVQSPVPASDHSGLAVADAAAGASELTLTNGNSTAVSANDYADGWLWCDDGTNVGQVYRVKSNTAADTDDPFTVELYDELAEALNNGVETVSLHANPYKNLIIHPSVPTAHVVGVPAVDLDGDEFGWIQTWGPCAVLTEGTVVIANHVAVADSDDGAVQEADSYVELIVGDVMRVEDDGEYSLIYLRLAP